MFHSSLLSRCGRFYGIAAGIALSLLAVLNPTAAQAQITFTLSPTITSGQPGDVLAFLATVANTGSEPMDLSGAAGNTDSSSLQWDDTDFINTFSSALAPSEIRSETLFITIANLTSPGVYSASYDVEFTGQNSGDIFPGAGTARVTITAGGSANAPEPTAAGLMGTSLGVLALTGLARRRGR